MKNRKILIRLAAFAAVLVLTAGIEVLAVKQLILVVDLNAAREIQIELAPVLMRRIVESLVGLREDGIGGNQPDDEARLSCRQLVEDARER